MYPVSGFGSGIGAWQPSAPLLSSSSRPARHAAPQDWKTSLDEASATLTASNPQRSSPTLTAPQEAIKPENPPSEGLERPAPLAIQQYIQDIQTVASKAGYVGVSQNDIERAYRRGESLLVDYSV